MCTCVKDIDAGLLKDEQQLPTTLFRDPPRVAVGLSRKDTGGFETRSRKNKYILANYCPFCGEKYTEAKAAEADL